MPRRDETRPLISWQSRLQYYSVPLCTSLSRAVQESVSTRKMPSVYTTMCVMVSGGATAERSGILVLYYNCVLLGKRREKREKGTTKYGKYTRSTAGPKREPRSLRAYYIGVL